MPEFGIVRLVTLVIVWELTVEKRKGQGHWAYITTVCYFCFWGLDAHARLSSVVTAKGNSRVRVGSRKYGPGLVTWV